MKFLEGLDEALEDDATDCWGGTASKLEGNEPKVRQTGAASPKKPRRKIQAPEYPMHYAARPKSAPASRLSPAKLMQQAEVADNIEQTFISDPNTVSEADE